MSEPVTKDTSAPSPKVKALCARLAAVQAIYQNSQNAQDYDALIKEYLCYRSDMEVDGEKLVSPNEKLLTSILRGVQERGKDLAPIIKEHLKKGEEERRIDPLMMGVFMCASYELMAGDIDSPIVINDYLNIAHNYYDAKEVSLVNAVLDNISKVFK